MSVDLILVGAGLANSLIAWRLAELRPDVKTLMLEAGSTVGGNHTWCFHTSDITPQQHNWLRPLIVADWPCHEVRFPDFRKRLDGGYHMLNSECLSQRMHEHLNESIRLNSRVREIEPNAVTLDGGETIEAAAVIDGRGPTDSCYLDVRFQKFIGQVLELKKPHDLPGPIIMDATVPQTDGYRFVYTLPLEAQRVLVEDTYYSDHRQMDAEPIRSAISEYCQHQGWSVSRVVGEEFGVLPVALGGDIDAFWSSDGQAVPRSGLRAALFHPVTGYSLPHAASLADAVAEENEINSASLFHLTRSRSIVNWRRGGFFRVLTRMLFLAATPEQRYRVLQRFYSLGEPLIQRFYAGRLTATDKMRLLSGRPPVSPWSAGHALLTYRFHSPPVTKP